MGTNTKSAFLGPKGTCMGPGALGKCLVCLIVRAASALRHDVFVTSVLFVLQQTTKKGEELFH